MKKTLRWTDFFIAAIGVFFALAYAWGNPIFEAPDEPEHLKYINFLAQRGTLPNQLVESDFVPQGHHHPLYHAVSAALVRIFDTEDHNVGVLLKKRLYPASVPEAPKFEQSERFSEPGGFKELRILRSLNSLFVGLTVLFSIFLARKLVPEPFPALAGLFVALLPQFSFIGGSLSNDILAALLSVITLNAAVAAFMQPSLKAWAWVGLWLGLAILTKKSCLVLLAPAVFLTLFSQFKTSEQSPKVVPSLQRLKCAGAMLSITLAVCGWLFVRNFMLYGDWLGSAMEEHTLSFLVDRKNLEDPFFARAFWYHSMNSFIGHFGWMNVAIPRSVTLLAGILIAVPTLLSLRAAADTESRIFVATLWLTVACTTAGVVYYNLTFTQPQGRLYFPMLGALAVLAAYGMAAVGKKWPKYSLATVVLWGIAGVMIGLASFRANQLHYENFASFNPERPVHINE